MDVSSWLLDFVRTFRALHFFEKYSSLSDAALGNLLAQWHVAAWGRAIDPDDARIDLRLASSDESRVWWRDVRVEIKEDDGVYAGLLQEWSAISRGAFMPTEIAERWDGYQGPIALSFLYDDEMVRVYPRFMSDEIDVGVLAPISRLIEKTGVEFCVHEKFDDTAFVVALTAAEKKYLQQQRRWRFEV